MSTKKFIIDNEDILCLYLGTIGVIGSFKQGLFLFVCMFLYSVVVCLGTFFQNKKFPTFMLSEGKIIQYLKIAVKSNPGAYLFLLFCWLIILFWMIQDIYVYKFVKNDVFLGFVSLYVVSSVMIFLGYYKKYDELP